MKGRCGSNHTLAEHQQLWTSQLHTYPGWLKLFSGDGIVLPVNEIFPTLFVDNVADGVEGSALATRGAVVVFAGGFGSFDFLFRSIIIIGRGFINCPLASRHYSPLWSKGLPCSSSTIMTIERNTPVDKKDMTTGSRFR